MQPLVVDFRDNMPGRSARAAGSTPWWAASLLAGWRGRSFFQMNFVVYAVSQSFYVFPRYQNVDIIKRKNINIHKDFCLNNSCAKNVRYIQRPSLNRLALAQVKNNLRCDVRETTARRPASFFFVQQKKKKIYIARGTRFNDCQQCKQLRLW